MFKVNNNDTRTTSMTSCSSVSVVNFEHVIAGWETNLKIGTQNQQSNYKEMRKNFLILISSEK